MKNYQRKPPTKILLFALLEAAILFGLACGKQVETARKTQSRTNEATAVSALQNIFRAQTQYSVMHSGDYGTFDQLVAEGSLDRRYAGSSPVLEGYVFTIRVVPQSGGGDPSFSVNADPKEVEGAPSGVRHLYLDSSSNVIRTNPTQAAKASDPPLQ